MASLIKQRDWFYAQFYDRTRTPQRKQVPLKTKTKKTAQALLRRLEDAYALSKFDPWISPEEATPEAPPPPPQSLGNSVSTFLEEKAHLRAATVRNYQGVLRLFVRTVGPELRVKTLSRSHVESFLASLSVGDVSRRTYVRHLRVFFRWLVSNEAIEADPTAKIALRRTPDRFPKYLTREDLDRLLEAITAKGKHLWLAPVVEVTAYLGLRLGEVCDLRWEAVDLETCRIRVANTDDFTTKSGRERTLPMPSRVQRILAGLRSQSPDTGKDSHVFRNGRGTPLTGDYLSHRFQQYRKLSGLPEGLPFHVLRHTSASWLMMNGASIEAIRRYLGHSSVTVTQKYAHLAPDAFASQIALALDKAREG